MSADSGMPPIVGTYEYSYSHRDAPGRMKATFSFCHTWRHVPESRRIRSVMLQSSKVIRPYTVLVARVLHVYYQQPCFVLPLQSQYTVWIPVVSS